MEQFIQRVHKYEGFAGNDPHALRELVKGIYIEAPDKSSGKRRQGIRISYDLVGFIPVDELMKPGNSMTEAMPFLQKQYYFLMPRPFRRAFLWVEAMPVPYSWGPAVWCMERVLH